MAVQAYLLLHSLISTLKILAARQSCTIFWSLVLQETCRVQGSRVRTSGSFLLNTFHAGVFKDCGPSFLLEVVGAAYLDIYRTESESDLPSLAFVMPVMQA